MKIGIIGAGPSGLSMALFLKHGCQVLEMNDHPGGHASSFIDQGYTFDNGPHIMFSKNKEILDFMVSSLGKNVHVSKRNNKISYKGRLVKFPFENDLHSLPLEDTYECISTYLFNQYKRKYRKPKNMRQWFLKSFGSGICEKYLFPYNEKVWNIPVDTLSMLWADRIPNPPAEDVLKSAIGLETEGYLHQLYYHYPLRGGYQAISDAWAKHVTVEYSCRIQRIEKTNHDTYRIYSDKKTYEFDQLVSTIPIQELVKILKIRIPTHVQKAVQQLIVNPMIIISLGIKGNDKNKYTAIYFPESDLLVNRISFPKTFSPYNAPNGRYSIQAEITCRKNSETWRMSDMEIRDHVIDGLFRRGIIAKKADIVYTDVRRTQYAYVVYDLSYERNTKIVREWFPKQGIHLVGRFSYFEYVNVDGVIARSLEISSKLNGSPVRLINNHIAK